ncbi:UNVERIFIED_CONTAM: hypothetical protein K2H54_031643 [Gekko kuhli]
MSAAGKRSGSVIKVQQQAENALQKSTRERLVAIGRAAILSSGFLLTEAQDITVTVAPSQPSEGQDITLTPGGQPTFVLCEWFRGEQAEANRIFTYFPSTSPPLQQNGPNFTGRETGGSDCSLHIGSLMLNDSGVYVVSKAVVPASERGRVHVEVLELLTKPSVSAFPSPFLIESMGSVSLTCETTSEEVSVSWFYNGEPLSSSSWIQVSEDNRTVVIKAANRNDTGEYQCEVANPVSTSISDPLYVAVICEYQSLTVFGVACHGDFLLPSPVVVYPRSLSDGPETPEIQPTERSYNQHSEIRLSCYADAFPDPHYIWSLNGQERSRTSELLIRDATPEDSGSYVCQVQNVLTRQKSNAALEIEVAGSVSNVTIVGPSKGVEYHTVQLNCTSLGSLVSYNWFKGNQKVEPGDRVVLSDQNKTLTLTSSNRNDTASYVCQGVNSFSSAFSEPHWLEIFYGPDSPVIDPQESVYIEGSTLNLSCFADSNPPANYSWWYNDQLLEDQKDSQLLIQDLLVSSGGNYTCNATNDYTVGFNTTGLEITIWGNVSNVTIVGPYTAIEYHTVQLTCTSLGSLVSYYWFKGNQTVEPGDHVLLSEKNNTLTLISSNRNDAASYICQGVNSFSSAFSDPHQLEIFYGPDSPVIDPQESVYIEGSTLNLSCFADSNPPANYSWWYNDQLLEDQKDSQLLIQDLLVSSGGNYTCNATNDYTVGFNTTNLEITIWERVSNVTITSRSDKAIENEVLVLDCSSAGSSVSYTWSKGDQILESGGHITLGNSSLTFSPVRRDDTGSYTCTGRNIFSNSSATYLLDVLYGPDAPIISPPRHDYGEGSLLNLSCHADSHPPAQYTWSFNETERPEPGPQLTIPSLSFGQAGNYTCNASNPETNLPRWTDWEIRVLENVSQVSIQGPSETTENSSLTLSCTSRGSEVLYIWFKEDKTLEDGGHVSFSGLSRANLTLNPVSRSDTGFYTCHGNNSISEVSSEPFHLEVFYGPDDPIIISLMEHDYLEGSDLNISCRAGSNPVANYTWFFNKTEEVGNHSQLLIHDLSFDKAGDYTCYATNAETNISRTAVWEIRVHASSSAVKFGIRSLLSTQQEYSSVRLPVFIFRGPALPSDPAQFSETTSKAMACHQSV